MTTPASSNDNIIRVLLVEDHVLTRIGLKTVLSRTTDIVVIGEADNGQDAIEKVEALSPDVVLMDVGMPVMDGIEAAGKLKVSHPSVNIVMLTSHDNDRDIFASLSAGAGGYCLKDVLPDRLYTAIRSVHNGDIWLDSSIASRVVRLYSSPGLAGNSGAGSDTKFGDSPGGYKKPVGADSTEKAQAVGGAAALAEPLSPRELEVLGLLVEGLSNQEIADRLIISLATAKTHVRNILNKLAVDDRTQAAVQAMRRGLV